MAQVIVSAQLTNGSTQVVVSNEDLRSQIHSGFMLVVDGEIGAYFLAGDPTFAGTDTTITLTAPYGGTTGVKAVTLVTDYTVPDSIPLINSGDVHTSTIFTQAMQRVQALLSAANVDFALQKSSNLADLSDAAAARTNLGLGSVENKSSAAIRGEITAANVTTALGYTPWQPGNDGAGSGLDADLLDGQDGSFYQNASSITAGILAAARLGTGAADDTKFLAGDNVWRTLTAADIAAGLSYTPANRAGDTMQGDLLFASGKKVTFADEYGTKLLLSGVPTAGNLIQLDATNTAWDFNHNAPTGVDKWRFLQQGNVRLQIDATGLKLNGLPLASAGLGLLSVGQSTHDEEVRIYSRLDGVANADWEALRLKASSTGMQVHAGLGGAGVAQGLDIGTEGDADLVLSRHGGARWIIQDHALIPGASLASDFGSATSLIRNVYLGGMLITSTGGVAIGLNATNGVRFPNATSLALTSVGADMLLLDGVKLNTNGFPIWLGGNVKLVQEALGQLSMKDGANAQSFTPYLSDDGAGNWVRGLLGWSGTTFKVGQQTGGTSAMGNTMIDGLAVQLATAGTARVQVNPTNVSPIGAIDLGASGARFATGYIDTLEQVKTWADAGNNEWAGAAWSGNDWLIGPRAAGTGQYHNVVIQAGNAASAARIRFGASNQTGVGSFSLEDTVGNSYASIANVSASFMQLATSQARGLQITPSSNLTRLWNGTNGQSLHVYSTDDGTNYERGELKFAGTAFIIGTAAAGTGTVRDIQFAPGASPSWAILGVGRAFVPVSPNQLDIGSATQTVKDGYFAGTVTAATFAGALATSNLTGTVAATNLGTGTHDSTTFLRGDGTWAVPPGATGNVTSFNTRTGAVTLSSADVTGALTFTPYNSTNPSGFISSAGAPVQSVFGRTGAVALGSGDVTGALGYTPVNPSSVSSSSSASTIVQRDGSGHIYFNYGFGTYVNSSDDTGSGGGLTYVMGKCGDNYHRSVNRNEVNKFLHQMDSDIAGQDLNTITTPGTYMGYSLGNAPATNAGGWMLLEVFRNAGLDQVFQRLTNCSYDTSNSATTYPAGSTPTQFTNADQIWTRGSSSGGSGWTAWKAVR